MAASGESTRADAATPEQRAAQRYTLLLRAAKLIAADREYLCILRDVSATGLKVRLFHPLPDSADWQLELGQGEQFALDPVWQADGHAGFRFRDAPVDPHRLVDEEAGPFPRRHIRLHLELPVMVWADGAAQAVTLCDLSQLGALVRADPPLALRQPVRIESPGFPLRHARVRWRRGVNHGLVFQEAFRLDELALLVAGLQGAPGMSGIDRSRPRVNQ